MSATAKSREFPTCWLCHRPTHVQLRPGAIPLSAGRFTYIAGVGVECPACTAKVEGQLSPEDQRVADAYTARRAARSLHSLPKSEAA